MNISLNTAKDYISAVPGLIGFMPADSVVMSMFVDERLLVTTRADDWHAFEGPYIEQMNGVIEREGVTNVLFAYFGDNEIAYGKLIEDFSRLDVVIRDALIVSGGRYWSIICASPGCEECDGTIHESDYQSSPMSLGAVTSGLRVAASRDDVVAEIKTAQRATKAWRVGSDIGESIKLGAETDQDFLWDGYRYCAELLDTNTLKDEEVCAIAWLLDEVRIRDAVMVHLLESKEPFRVYAQLAAGLRSVPAKRSVPILALIGLAAYLSGDCVRAGAAIDTSSSLDGRYELTRLLDRSLSNGIHPNHIREALGGLTVETALQVSAS